jgi:DNA-binding transcriptional ArsR family regulator
VITYEHPQLDALGDGTRRAILARLLDGPLPVGELAREFPVSRPAISQHLRVLKDARLVTDRADGTRRVYALNPDAFESLREYFDHFWNHALAAFKRRVEHPAPAKANVSGGASAKAGRSAAGSRKTDQPPKRRR